MYPGFPVSLLSLLRCSHDGGELSVAGDAGASHIQNGLLRCPRGHDFQIADGIVSLLREAELHDESAREMRLRDQKVETLARERQSEWRSPFADATEVRPTLQAVGPWQGKVVGEIGCGSGRYTTALKEGVAQLLAIDFSRASLVALREKLSPDDPVGLVQSDAAAMRLAPRSFDRFLSTLHSNLPTRDHRLACLQSAAHALKDDGRFVVSMHYRGARDFALAIPPAGRYPDSGIYRYHMSVRESATETAPFFARVKYVHLKVAVGLPIPAVSLLAARLPLVRGLARLFLAVAEQPRREPPCDQVSAASSLASGIFGRGLE